MQFYELSGGPTTDGVIAITPEIIIKLLEIVGPIDMPEYNETVTAENFMWVAEYNVELEYDKKENTPKKFLADLSIKLLEKLVNQTKNSNLYDLMEVFGGLGKMIKEKDIQLYFSDENLEKTVKKYSLSGEIKKTPGDYLLVVNSNIGGGKTDGVISQIIDLTTTIKPDGSLINKLVIKRLHKGNPNDYFQKVRNVDWIRIYVPEGSELLRARGFISPEAKYFSRPEGPLENDKDLTDLEGGFLLHDPSGTRIYNQFGKTVFANWSMVDVGEEAVIELEYRLPFKIEKIVQTEEQNQNLISNFLSKFTGKENSGFKHYFDNDLRSYTLLVQKQAGINSYFYHTLNMPEKWKNVWTNFSQKDFATLNQDKILGYIFDVE